MKRYNLLNENDLIKGNTYECICLIGNNKNPRNMNIYYDKYGYWCTEDNVSILAVVDNSIMYILHKRNIHRYQEVVDGGKYEDYKYESHYMDCEEYYNVTDKKSEK